MLKSAGATAVIYRWRLKAGTEQNFSQAWRRLTEAIRDRRGGLGSRLHRGEDGVWWAYAQWPSRRRWTEAQELPTVDEDAARSMRECIDESLPALHLSIEDDLLEAL